MNRLRIASLIVIVCLLGIPLTTRVGIRAAASPSAIKCSLEQYKASPGLTAAPDQNGVVISWTGQGGAELRARYAIEEGQPVIRELGIRKPGGAWTVLGENLIPEYHVVSGIRRLPNDQGGALQRQGIAITQEVIDKNRWYAFWDAPLLVPGTPQPAAGRGGQTAAPTAAPAATAPGVIPLGRGERSMDCRASRRRSDGRLLRLIRRRALSSATAAVLASSSRGFPWASLQAIFISPSIAAQT